MYAGAAAEGAAAEVAGAVEAVEGANAAAEDAAASAWSAERGVGSEGAREGYGDGRGAEEGPFFPGQACSRGTDPTEAGREARLYEGRQGGGLDP